MRAIALVVVVTEEERVRPILGPHVAELRGIPERLVRQLGHAHRVRRGAGTSGCESFFRRVEHVVLVVRRVEVLAIPARREVMHSHDATFARLRREVGCLGEPRVLVLETHKA